MINSLPEIWCSALTESPYIKNISLKDFRHHFLPSSAFLILKQVQIGILTTYSSPCSSLFLIYYLEISACVSQLEQIHSNPFLQLAPYTTTITFPSQIHVLFCCLYAHRCRTIHEHMGSLSVVTAMNKTEQNQTKQLSPQVPLIADNFSTHSTRQNSQLVSQLVQSPMAGWSQAPGESVLQFFC